MNGQKILKPDNPSLLQKIFDKGEEIFHHLIKADIIRRIVANSGMMGIATMFAAATGFAQGIFVVRLLGPVGVGLLSAITQFTNVINRFVSFRINELVVRFVRLYIERKQPEKAKAVFKLAGLFEATGSFLAFLLITLLAPLGVKLFADDPTTATSWFMAYGFVVLFNMIYDSSNGLLQVFNKFKELAVINVLQNFLTLILVIIVALAKGGLINILIVYLVGKLIGAIGVTSVAFMSAREEWGRDWWRAPLSVLREDRRSLFTFAFSTNFSATISLVAKDSESLWVNGFLGNEIGGYHMLALTLVGFIQIPISPLPSTTYPELSRAVARKNWSNLRYILRRGSTMAALYTIPITLLLILLGKQVIQLYSGPEFLPAYPALVILLVGYSVANIFYWNRVGLLSLNRPVFPTAVNFVGMLLKVTGIYYLVPRYEYLAFAGLLAGYYIFTVGVTAAAVSLDVRKKLALVPAA
jgi:O-antigen/teichoic acid export membrane protein